MSVSESNDKKLLTFGAPVTKPAKSKWRFAEFTLDLERQGLYKGTEWIHLSPKPFQTLAYLVENCGATVSKQKILDSVWKDAFVTEDTLVKAIREIRRVLGDDKENPRFIQTVSGLGYRFITEVTQDPFAEGPRENAKSASTDALANKGVSPVAAELPTRIGARGRPLPALKIWVSVVILALAGLLASLAWWQPRSKPHEPVQRLISTFPGGHLHATFSPDASMIAFLMLDTAGVYQIWLKNLAQGDPVPITSDPGGAGYPRWSPKNDQIIFYRFRKPGSGDTLSISPIGGTPRLLIADALESSFSSDGSQIVFQRLGEIWTANADGKNQRKVEGVAPQVGSRSRAPSFSPDSSWITYVHHAIASSGDIWLIPSRGGTPRQLSFDNVHCDYPLWTPDGQHIIFSSARRGSQTLWKVRASGGEPQPVLVSAGRDSWPDISRDGKKLIYTTVRYSYALTVLDPATRRARELRETSSRMVAPTFAPTGDKIAFFSLGQGGNQHLFTIGADGRNINQVTQGEGERNWFPQWSRDGEVLYYYQERPSASLRKILIQGGQDTEVLKSLTLGEWVDVHPDGNLMVRSRRENGVAATFLYGVATGKETLFRMGVLWPRWSPDGEAILGVDQDILICSAKNGQCRKLATTVGLSVDSSLRAGAAPIWSADGSRVYFSRFRSSGGLAEDADVYSISVDGTDERLEAELKSLVFHSGSDVSAKGEVAYIQLKAGKPDLYMIDLK
jgi:Tol biopolymer transport system component/DNA-binding winged helix-turn-helix (wHTH) protein